MILERPAILLVILVMTILSGIGDSQGFVHATNIWQNGRLVWSELGKSALGFFAGILIYWLVLRFMREVGIVTPEIQTLIWFAVTLVGVALAGGNLFKWQLVDQVVALSVLIGIGWLLLRTGAAG